MPIARESLDQLLSLLRARYGAWSGFSDASFLADEVEYKQRIAAASREFLNSDGLGDLVHQARWDEFLARLEKVAKFKGNNLLYLATPRAGDLSILYHPQLDKPTYCHAVFDLLHGPGKSSERLDRYATYVSERQLPNKWTFPTHFLFFCHPETDIFVKPTRTKAFLQLIGSSIELGLVPSGGAYSGLQYLARELSDALSDYGPTDMIGIQSLMWVCAQQAIEKGTMELSAERRKELLQLFAEFVRGFCTSPEGKQHASLYEPAREQGRKNYVEIAARADQGTDVTEEVLLKLLPYVNSASNREKGAWIHVAPCIQGDLKKWFEGARWASSGDWPAIAQSILQFVRRCSENPGDLGDACEEFARGGYSKGLQTGMLTPILNALNPDQFFLINNMSRDALNYFAGTSHDQSLDDYAAANATLRQLLKEVSSELHAQPVPPLRDGDLFDMFTYWLVAVKEFGFAHTRYWKIAPGEGAHYWDECKEGGFVAIGWDDLGDVSGLSRQEFKARLKELLPKHADWTQSGADQVWKFAHMAVGDRVVVNRGTEEVLGIGTIAGPYFYLAGSKYPHRLQVQWNDLTARRVQQGGWRKTLVELDRKTFEEVRSAPPVWTEPPAQPKVPSGASPFTAQTFALLEQLRVSPTKDVYVAHKQEFRDHLERPFQELFEQVVTQLRPEITELMETEKHVFSRIPKNDYGRGGAWPFYWGALYPKGGKRIEDAQLYASIDADRLGFGFYMGEYASSQRERFVRNCRAHYQVLTKLLKPALQNEKLNYGSPEESTDASSAGAPIESTPAWKEWLERPERFGIRVAAVARKEDVLATSAQDVTRQIADAFRDLFPLVLLATLDDPLPSIKKYLSLAEEEVEANPEYSLATLADECFVELPLLDRWVRAIERKRQAILYGPPGTGKTFLAERLARHLVGGGDGILQVVQFHPAYAYEDFMQGIRPQARPEGGLDYPLVPGRFLDFCEQARTRTGRSVLVIDEINRANIARVFGELMYLLEYRDEDIPLAGGRRFKIPQNVRIIGTMNTADRSIALVDHALRRRFAFIHLRPQYDILRQYHEVRGTDVSGLIDTLRQLNTQIGDPHYEVGASFFLVKELRAHLEDIWRMEIEPYLEEYFFDQPQKAAPFRWNAIKDRVTP